MPVLGSISVPAIRASAISTLATCRPMTWKVRALKPGALVLIEPGGAASDAGMVWAEPRCRLATNAELAIAVLTRCKVFISARESLVSPLNEVESQITRRAMHDTQT